MMIFILMVHIIIPNRQESIVTVLLLVIGKQLLGRAYLPFRLYASILLS